MVADGVPRLDATTGLCKLGFVGVAATSVILGAAWLANGALGLVGVAVTSTWWRLPLYATGGDVDNVWNGAGKLLENEFDSVPLHETLKTG